MKNNNPQNEEHKRAWLKSIDELAYLVDDNKANEAYNIAVELLKKATIDFGESNYYTFLLNDNLGIISMLLGKYDEAEQYLLKAIDIAECAEGTLVSDMASVTRHLALLYQAKARVNLNS